MPAPEQKDTDTGTSNAEGKKKRKEAAPQTAQQGHISFVAFDGGTSDATRKAVRKQAALASAAARKATIAKKIARQKEQRSLQASGTSSDRAGVELPLINAVAAATSTQAKEGAKRKREDAAQPWKHGISIVQETPEQYYSVGEESSDRRKKTQPHIVSRYLSPPITSADERRLPGRHSYATSRPDNCDVEEEQVPEDYINYNRQITSPKRHHRGMMSDDYIQLEDSYLPPTPESLASPMSSGASMMDPFNNFPVQYHPLYERLLHHMLTIQAPRAWPTLKITNTEGLAWEHYMTQNALAEPALFLVRVLFASGDLIRLGVLDQNVSTALRSLAIKSINEALMDPSRYTSDGLILAVGRIALTESLYGDKNVANMVHRPAQRRMIDLRGGMNALAFPPLVKRLMRWADKVMSVQSDTPRLLPDVEDQGNSTYDMSTSVVVLENWAPQAGRALRRKIAISDLIT